MDYEEIKADVEKVLSEKRFTHSVGVAKKAVELAKIYGVDEDIAKKTAIAHDVAKEITKEEKLNYAKEHNIEVDEIESAKPSLLHGKIGADIAAKKYGFSEDMQNAIKFHTTGRANMSILEKIIYVADKIEENRKGKKVDIEKARELSKKDIDETIIFLMDESIVYNIGKEGLVHPKTIEARNYLLMHKN